MDRKTLRGVVVQGARRGKALGYPTANLDISSRDLPESGIYAVWVRISGEAEWRKGAASIGVKPTFGRSSRGLEIHLFDFEGQLYGKTLEVVISAYLRPEMKFENAESLVAQMQEDCRRARRLLSERNRPESEK